MMFKRFLRDLIYICALTCGGITASAQTTSFDTEFLMTFYAPLEAQQIDSGLTVFNVIDGGTVKGPKINGTILTPSADWFQTLPSGNFQVDVRGTIKTDDGALIYISYGGIVHYPNNSLERLMNGEMLTPKDFYFVTTPTFRTSAENYAWLNNVQCIGRAVEVQVGEKSFVKYEIFVVR